MAGSNPKRTQEVFPSQGSLTTKNLNFCTDDGANLSTCLFDDADDEFIQDVPTTPTSVKPQQKAHAFGSYAMKYFGQKFQDHAGDMETEHSNRMLQLSEFESSQLLECRGARDPMDCSPQVDQFPALDDSSGMSDKAEICGPRVIISGQNKTRSIPIPNTNLPPRYQNSKILSSFYSQIEHPSSLPNTWRSAPSSPSKNEPRSASHTPETSPRAPRKAYQSRVNNRDVNVWAPGSL